MKVGASRKPYDEINITPMLDLAYVLLVIFIIMTTAAVQGIKVQLPTASAAQSLSEAKTRVVAVANDGQVSIDAIPVTLDELERMLRDALANDPKLPVVLRGDRAVQYDRIMEVLNLCAKLGIPSIGLASQRAPD